MVRRTDGASQRIAGFVHGQELCIRREPDNPYDPRALLFEVTTNESVDSVPAYLLDEVHKHREEATPLHVTV